MPLQRGCAARESIVRYAICRSRSRNDNRASLEVPASEQNLLLLERNPEDNHGFTLNADKLINCLIRSRGICLLVVALFFLSGPWANADPVGDFFKKVGRSISKAFQPQPAQPQPTKKKRASRRSTAQEQNAAGATPIPLEEPLKPSREQKFTPTVLPAFSRACGKSKRRHALWNSGPRPERHGHKSLFTGGKLHRCQRFSPRVRCERSIYRKDFPGAVTSLIRSGLRISIHG